MRIVAVALLLALSSGLGFSGGGSPAEEPSYLGVSEPPEPGITVPPGFVVEVFAEIDGPVGMLFEADGDLLIIHLPPPSTIDRISIVDGENTGMSTVAGPDPLLQLPQYLAADAAGAVYTANSNVEGGEVVRIDPDTGSVTVFAAGLGSVLEDGRGLAFMATGDLLAANNIMSANDPSVDAYITKYLVMGGAVVGQVDQFIAPLPNGYDPLEIAFGPDGALYMATDDALSRATFDGAGNLVSLDLNYAVLPTSDPTGDFAAGLGFDLYGNVWVSTANYTQTDGGKVFVVDTTGNPTLFATGFSNPRDIVVDDKSRVYVSDLGTDRVYRISAPPPEPRITRIDPLGGGVELEWLVPSEVGVEFYDVYGGAVADGPRPPPGPWHGPGRHARVVGPDPPGGPPGVLLRGTVEERDGGGQERDEQHSRVDDARSGPGGQ